MEFEFPVIWILLVVAGYIISSMNKAKKKQETKAYQQAHPAKPAAQPQAAQPKDSAWEEEDGEDDGWSGRAVPQFTAPAPAQPVPAHTAEPLEAHMHTPVMGAEGEGTEGMDCCHEYMLGQTDGGGETDILPLREQGESERAKALLQGVIFSEILGRRPIKHYGGKRA